MHQLWPNAKFILTTRPSEEWIASMQEKVGGSPTPMQRFIYGATDPTSDPEAYIARKERHDIDVATYFAQFPRSLLSLDISASDGQKYLCSFLNKPCPTNALLWTGPKT
jgi:hypothetical protein